MEADQVSKFMKGYSSRCVCCNAVLSDNTFSSNRFTKEMDPTCSQCRKIIKMSVNDTSHVSGEQEIWREPMGQFRIDTDSDTESTYQGYN